MILALGKLTNNLFNLIKHITKYLSYEFNCTHKSMYIFIETFFSKNNISHCSEMPFELQLNMKFLFSINLAYAQ